MYVVSSKAEDNFKHYNDRIYKSLYLALEYAQELLKAGYIVKLTEVS